MIISDFGLKPYQTIYYIAGEILLEIIQNEKSEAELIMKIFGDNPRSYEIKRFNYALYFLLLTDKFIYKEKDGVLKYVYKET